MRSLARLETGYGEPNMWTRISSVRAIALVVSLAIGLTVTEHSDAAVYWTNRGHSDCFEPNGSIGRANLDGSLVDQSFITGADLPVGVAVNTTHIFWSNQGPCDNSVGRANLDGTEVDQLYLSGDPGLAGPTGVALDDANVYWGNLFGGDSIGAADLAGTSIDPAFIPGTAGACAIAVDPDWLYWANSGINSQSPDANTIGRGDGSTNTQHFIDGADAPCGVAVDSSYVYWTNTGGTTIGRANLDGTGPDQSFITGASHPCGIAVDADHIYWANSATGTIGRANLDGSEPDQSFITGADAPCGVAVDAAVVEPVAPSNSSRPAISGVALPGQVLTCARGSWLGLPLPTDFAYQWVRDGSLITGAMGAGYVIVAPDLGHEVSCQVTATNSGGKTTESSLPVQVPAPPANMRLPLITGTRAVGQKLTCSRGDWSGAQPQTYDYAWLREGKALRGATKAAHTVSRADSGHDLSCRVTARNIVGAAAPASSAAVHVPALPPLLSLHGRARVKGPTVTLTLRCAVGTTCRGAGLVTASERVRGNKILGVSSSTRRTRSKVVTVATKRFTIAAGHTKSIKLRLNRSGRTLLERFGKLPARLSVSLSSRSRPAVARTIRFRASRTR
jgi:virginiamycin B lyase